MKVRTTIVQPALYVSCTRPFLPMPPSNAHGEREALRPVLDELEADPDHERRLQPQVDVEPQRQPGGLIRQPADREGVGVVRDEERPGELADAVHPGRGVLDEGARTRVDPDEDGGPVVGAVDLDDGVAERPRVLEREHLADDHRPLLAPASEREQERADLDDLAERRQRPGGAERPAPRRRAPASSSPGAGRPAPSAGCSAPCTSGSSAGRATRGRAGSASAPCSARTGSGRP